MSPELQAIMQAMMGRQVDPLPFRDPAQVAAMLRQFGFDSATGDPVISIGMDARKVSDMTDPVEKSYNWGTYYQDDDSVWLNPDIPASDYRETAQHEFRHRGAHMLDQAAGRPQDFNLEEIAMLMTDMGAGIGTHDYNTSSIGYLHDDYARQNGIRPMEALRKADSYATAINHEARQAIGRGARYTSPVDELIGLMIPAYVGGAR